MDGDDLKRAWRSEGTGAAIGLRYGRRSPSPVATRSPGAAPTLGCVAAAAVDGHRAGRNRGHLTVRLDAPALRHAVRAPPEVRSLGPQRDCELRPPVRGEQVLVKRLGGRAQEPTPGPAAARDTGWALRPRERSRTS
jgi:hypothetical protein